LDRFFSTIVIDMDEARLQTISQLCVFVTGTLELQFIIPDSNDRRYAHIVTLAQRFGYARLNRPRQGGDFALLTAHQRLFARSIEQAAGQQSWMASHWASATRRKPMGLPYPSRCTAVGAGRSGPHGTMSGLATVHLLQRALGVYGDARSNDNALAESKNASLVRKALGYKPYPAAALPLSSMHCVGNTSNLRSICTTQASLPGRCRYQGQGEKDVSPGAAPGTSQEAGQSGGCGHVSSPRQHH
jgi:hypothetical protein